jgi:hypothetical protein
MDLLDSRLNCGQNWSVFIPDNRYVSLPYQIHRKDVIMLTRCAVLITLVLFLFAGLSPVVLAEEEDAMAAAFAKRQERMKIAMEAEAREPAEAVAALTAPPESEAVTLDKLPAELADMLSSIYQYKEGDPLFLSTAPVADVANHYADALAPLSFSGNVMVDENGKPISPAFSFMNDLGVIRVVAAEDDSIEGKVLAAVIIIAE